MSVSRFFETCRIILMVQNWPGWAGGAWSSERMLSGSLRSNKSRVFVAHRIACIVLNMYVAGGQLRFNRRRVLIFASAAARRYGRN
jgi:hypothetical protein